MRYIALGILIIAAFFVPALLAAAQAIYRAGQQQKAEEEQKHNGYHEAHPYIRQQKQIARYAAERLRYWLFARGKGCHACCLRCKHYGECKALTRVAKIAKHREKERKRRK